MTLPPTDPRLSTSWALQMRATTVEEPQKLIQSLTGAVLSSGGWVLSRGANDAGTINMLFEFERQACLEIYTALIAVGLELSQLAHLKLTELCQCTRSHFADCSFEIVSIDLEIYPFLAESNTSPRRCAKRG